MKEQKRIYGLRLLALALAVLAWFFITVETREEVSEKLIDVTVRYEKPEGIIILNRVEKIRLVVSGSESRMRNLNPILVDVVAEIPPDSGKGALEINLGPENVILPDGLQVVSIDPNTLSLDLDRESRQLIPIVPQVTGEPSAGALVIDAIAVPDRVLVRGPESRLRDFQELTTSAVDLTGHAITFEEHAAVLSPDPNVTVIQPAVVTVRVNLRVPGTGDTEESSQ